MNTISMPKPYDFTNERERIATHDARIADALEQLGGHGVCPYCYEPARLKGIHAGKRLMGCSCGLEDETAVF
jgi:hypothetical protein